MRKEFFTEFDECTKESEEQTNNNMRNLLRQFKNIGNYLHLLFDPDVYGLCKLYRNGVPTRCLFLYLPFVVKTHLFARQRA